MKAEHVLSCQVARYLRMRGYVTLDCDVMSALKYLPVQDSRNRAMFVASRKAMAYTLGQADIVCINKYGNVSFLELKNGETGKQSDNQKYFEQEIKCRGGNYVLIRSFDDCINFVKGDLKPRYRYGDETVYAINHLNWFMERTACPKYIKEAIEQLIKEIQSGAECSNNEGMAQPQSLNPLALLRQE